MFTRKVINPGSIKRWEGGRYMSIFCQINFNDGKLSISGVEGPLRSGNCLGSCGQIDMHLRGKQGEIKLARGWTRELLAKFFEVWERWHLNDMKAGTPAQMAELEKHTFPEGHGNHYEWAKGILANAGLFHDHSRNGYTYGTAWLREEVPADVIQFLESLPESEKVPAWV